jgi:hypothetical protein
MSNERPQFAPEPPAIAARVVVFVAIGFLVFVGISLFLLRIYYGDEIDGAAFVPPKTFASPKLQIDDVADLAKLKDKQRHELSNYGWVNRDAGIIRIPIEEAMKQVVARGTDAYAPMPSEASQPSAAETPQ